MSFWTAHCSFSINTKKSLASTPKQRTQLAYIEPTRSANGSAMDGFPINQPIISNLSRDIFTLLLT